MFIGTPTDKLNIAHDLTTCKCCGAELRYYKQFSRYYGECTTADCDRAHITLELNDLAALTDEQVNDYIAGKGE